MSTAPREFQMWQTRNVWDRAAPGLEPPCAGNQRLIPANQIVLPSSNVA
jgi:hypothetical protein